MLDRQLATSPTNRPSALPPTCEPATDAAKSAAHMSAPPDAALAATVLYAVASSAAVADAACTKALLSPDVGPGYGFATNGLTSAFDAVENSKYLQREGFYKEGEGLHFVDVLLH